MERYRTLDVLDAWKRGDAAEPGAAKRRLGTTLNLPALQGIDTSGPVSFFRLPAFGPLTRSATIVRVADGPRLQAAHHAYGREGHLIRHAQLVRRVGDWAAFSSQRDVLGSIGETGLSIEARGEDLAVALDVSGFLALLWERVQDPAWRTPLAALGVAVDAPEWVPAQPGKPAQVKYSGTERVAALEATWSAARLWVWPRGRSGGEGTAEAELLLTRRQPRNAAAPSQAAPRLPQREGAAVELVVAGGPAQNEALAWGARFGLFPETALPEANASPCIVLRLDATPTTWLLAWQGPRPAWVQAFATSAERPAARKIRGWDALAVGPRASRALAALGPFLPRVRDPASAETPLLATARVPRELAARVLGDALAPGSVLAPFATAESIVIEVTRSPRGDQRVRLKAR